MNNIAATVEIFYAEIKKDENHRYLSWEHCYKYFKQESSQIDTDTACLHLAFYLASWGMYRGSSYLLWKDYKIHREVVELLLSAEYKVLQNTSFSENDIDKIIDLSEKVRKLYADKITTVKGKAKKIHASDILVTKILLGTLGCVPAYDRFFLDGLIKNDLRPLRFTKKSLQAVIEFYLLSEDKVNIDKLAESMNYPIMKILDMYFWQIGFQLSPEGKKELNE